MPSALSSLNTYSEMTFQYHTYIVTINPSDGIYGNFGKSIDFSDFVDVNCDAYSEKIVQSLLVNLGRFWFTSTTSTTILLVELIATKHGHHIVSCLH